MPKPVSMTFRLAMAALAAFAALPAAAQDAPASAPQQSAAAPAGQQPPPLEVSVTGGISAPMPIAVPTMPTNAPVDTAAGNTQQLGRQMAEVITDDLKNSGLFRPLGPDLLRPVGFDQVSQPVFDYWTTTGAQALVQGYVRANSDGSLTVGCYLYDVFAQKELTRQGFVVPPADWRRAAHKCADTVYTRLTGEGPYFDSRIVYISETGPKDHRIKRLAIMDQDGANHRFLTNGQSIVLTPRFAPNQQTIVFMSYEQGQPTIYAYDLGSGHTRRLISSRHLAFAPDVSPDGRYVIFTMSVGGDADIYRVPISGGEPQRLTNAPGIDTGGSFSPDGSKITFESDRSGTQQLYVMNADGSNQHRISFGGGRYATPTWSPRGDLIAFTHIAGGAFHVGVMSPSGSGEKNLTDGWGDEGPSWSPNGRVITFFRTPQGTAPAQIWSVDLTGVNVRHIPTPLGGSDPDWGPLRH